MIDKIITAYRAQIYDWSAKDFWAIVKNNKLLWISILAVSLAVIALLLASLIFNKTWLAVIAFAVEVVAIIVADRVAVKRYRSALGCRQDHLNAVVEFLKTTVPGVDLYNPEHINELVSRLSDRIDEKRPFARITSKLKSFSTAIVLPVITYIAGVYASQLQEIEVGTVITYGVGIILIIATIWLALSTFLDAVRPVFCRDYDAAVSLREDLMDLLLLHFCENRK